MVLGPVFVIHSGSAEDRAVVKHDLVSHWEDKYPYWTETFDVANANTVLAFSSNMRDAWTVGVADAYAALTNPEARTLDVLAVDASKTQQTPPLEKPVTYISFGGCRYP